MKLSTRLRQILRLQSASFVVLFLAVLGLAAWASTKYTAQADWTYGNRNTLSQASRELLATLDGDVQFEVFAGERKQLRERIRDVAQRYTRASDKVALTFTDPRTHPQKVRELGVKRQGTILIRYQGRTTKVTQADEGKITNAIKRLADTSTTTLAFLTGHGERPLQGRSRAALTAFKRQLGNQGYDTQTLTLAKRDQVPEDVSVLVVADPRQKLLPGELQRIRDFVARGGNLLWLADTGAQAPPAFDGKDLVKLGDGTIASPVKVFGARSKAFGVVASYPGSGITEDFSKSTVFPKARPVRPADATGWDSRGFLATGERSWADAGAFDPRFDEGEDSKGPITLGVSLTRPLPGSGENGTASAGDDGDGVVKASAGGASGKQTNGSDAGKDGNAPEQRIVVIGDADFLANGFLGFGGNQDLAMKTVKWLSGDTAYLDIPSPEPPDKNLQLSPTAIVVLQTVFMGGLPLAFLVIGGTTWLRQRRR